MIQSEPQIRKFSSHRHHCNWFVFQDLERTIKCQIYNVGIKILYLYDTLLPRIYSRYCDE